MVIPARWASSRFPGKVLAPLGGRPLVLRVADMAARAQRVQRVIVATDEERVAESVRAGGHEVFLTRPDHPSGTDRVAEVVRSLEAPRVIGLQADEPFLEPQDLDRLAEAIGPSGFPLATLAVPLAGREAWLDPNAVKVVTGSDGRALFFSRSPIPYVRPAAAGPLPFPPAGEPPAAARLHVGVYAWQREALFAFTQMPPSPLEQLEGLEQMRALEAGWPIAVLPAQGTPFGIDTPEDLSRAETFLAHRVG